MEVKSQLEGGREEREAGQLSYLFIMHSESRTDGRRTVVGWMSMEWRTRTDYWARNYYLLWVA